MKMYLHLVTLSLLALLLTLGVDARAVSCGEGTKLCSDSCIAESNDCKVDKKAAGDKAEAPLGQRLKQAFQRVGDNTNNHSGFNKDGTKICSEGSKACGKLCIASDAECKVTKDE
jgi:hypothetical protein